MLEPALPNLDTRGNSAPLTVTGERRSPSAFSEFYIYLQKRVAVAM